MPTRGRPARRARVVPSSLEMFSRSLEVRVVPGLDVGERNARDGAEDLALAVGRARGRRERDVLPEHVCITLTFAEQLTTALLEHGRHDVSGWRTSQRRDARQRAHAIDRVETHLATGR